MHQNSQEQVSKLIEQQEYQVAEELLLKFINQQPKNPNIFFLYGNLCSQQKNDHIAKKMYDQCLFYDPSHYRCLFNYANLLSELNEFENARTLYKKAKKINGSDPDLYNNLGLLYYDQKMYEQAEIQFHECLRLDPKHYLALNNLGILSYNLKWFRLAEKYLLLSKVINPQGLQAYYNLCLVQKSLSHHKEALGNLMLYLKLKAKQESVSLESLISDVPYRIVCYDQRLKLVSMFYNYCESQFQELILNHSSAEQQEDKLFVIEAYQLGIKLSQRRRFDILSSYASFLFYVVGDTITAKQIYSEAFDLNPSKLEFYIEYGEFLTQEGQKQMAFLIYLAGMRYSPTAKFFYTLACLSAELCYIQIAQYGFLMALTMTEQPNTLQMYTEKYANFLFAHEKYSTFISVCQSYADLRVSPLFKDYLLSLIYIRKYSEAKISLEDVLRNYPEDPGFEIIWGYLLFKMKKYSEAEKIYLKVLNNYECAFLFEKIAELLFFQKRFYDAEGYIVSSISLQQDNLCNSLLLFANIQNELKNYYNVQQTYKELTALFPQNKIVHRNYGNYLFSQGKRQQATERYMKAIMLADRVTTNLYWAELQFHEGNISEYQRRLKRCLQIDAQQIDATIRLAQLYNNIKINKQLAEQYYRKVLELDKYLIEHYQPYLDILLQKQDLTTFEQQIIQLRIDLTCLKNLKYAQTLVKLGKYIPAELMLTTLYNSEQLQPQSQLTYNQLMGIISSETQRYDKSVEHFNRYLAIKPYDDRILYKCGQSLGQMGNQTQAEEKYLKSIRINGNIEYILGFCQYLNKIKRFGKIIKVVEDLVKNNIDQELLSHDDKRSQYLEIMMYYSTAYETLKQYQIATKIYKESLELDPCNGLWQKKLANVLLKQGKLQEASNYRCYYSSHESKDKIPQKNKCKICMTDQISYINIRCGHFCVCEYCVKKLQNKCPICRQTGRFRKVYQ